MYNTENLMGALVNKINSILTGDDDHSPKDVNNYITWCLPGIPFASKDLQFAIQGLNGQKSEATKKLISTAHQWSKIANYIPSSSIFSHSQQKNIFNNTGATLWNIYNNVLKFSEVASFEISEEQKNKIQKFRNLLSITETIQDIITGKEKNVVVDSPMMKAYKEKQGAYLSASLAYNKKRLEAMNADNPEAVRDFAMNAHLYRTKLTQALEDWATNGYKNEVEKMIAYITQVASHDLTTLKADLKTKMQQAAIFDSELKSEFFFSNFYPTNFINDDHKWTTLTFSEKNMRSYSKNIGFSTSIFGSKRWGLWKLSPKVDFKKENNTDQLSMQDCHIEFELAQVHISRPWFSPEFLLSPAWQWKKGVGMPVLCDGGDPPKGQLIAYPTTVVFVKDVKITVSSKSGFIENIKKSIGGKISAGWGLFNLGTSHTKFNNKKTVKKDEHNHTLTIEGMQLIAFKCFPLGKTPNPNTEISHWV